MTQSEPTIVHRRQGRIARITLNRPRALNALTPDMIMELSAALAGYRDDPAVHAVVVEGAGKAFCAGGDVRALRDAVLAGHHNLVEQFFEAEYALNLAIARYPKPYVALIGGICMGGGIGLSVHGSARVASDDAVFAMPEAAIGLFPDVGATYALPRLRGASGMWMALTGARVSGPDAVFLGLATHYVPSDALPLLADALAMHGVAALADHAVPPPPGPAASAMDQMQCFTAPDVPAILSRLKALGTPWAQEALRQIAAASPAAILRTFSALRDGDGYRLEQALEAELALTRIATRHPDFSEGIRAMLVDKDRSPRWADAPLVPA